MNNDEKTIPPDSEHDPRLLRIISDLKNLPKVEAPSNFEIILRQRLTDPEIITLPWYKRFFIPRAEGGFAFPVYAYGSIAMIAICVLGYVVIKTSMSFEEPNKMVLQEREIPLKVGADQTSLPSQSKSELRQAPSSSVGETFKRQSGKTEGKPEQSHQEPASVSTQQPSTPPPSVSTQQPSTPPPTEKNEEAKRESGTSLRRSNISQHKIALPSGEALPTNAVKKADEKELQLKARGIMEPLDSAALSIILESHVLADSARIKDSLLQLNRDSLLQRARKK